MHTETERIGCPYCGEVVEVVLDPSVEEQEYIEDCYVCCRPMILTVVADGQGGMDVFARSENE